jgi:hypothetical protein
MSAILLAGLIMAQVSPITVEAPRGEQLDVAYSQLAAGKPQAAFERIAANRALAAEPAALINKGSALAMLGRIDAARASYRAALTSRERYYLELADGSWVDSREAAQRALRLLETGQVLALK